MWTGTGIFVSRSTKRRMDRMWPRWRTRRRRRALAVVGMAAMLSLVTSALVDGVTGLHPGWVLVWLAGTAVWVAVWLVLRVLTGGVAEAQAHALDERERATRNRLGYLGFNILVAVNMALALYLVLAPDRPGLAYQGGMLLVALSLGAASVPTWVLACTLPDDDPVGDLDDSGGDGPAAGIVAHRPGTGGAGG